MAADSLTETFMDPREQRRTLCFQPGTNLGPGNERYEFVRLLGSGAMGKVLLFSDSMADGCMMAVKTVPDVIGDNKTAMDALKEEYNKMLKLTHPGIVAVRNLVRDEFRYYIVMDYAEGETLEAYLQNHPKPGLAVTQEVVKRLAAALDYAHGEGLVHRDVKPANMMVQIDGEAVNSVKLLDFGLGLQIQKSLSQMTGNLTGGSPAYMSPEQWNPGRYGKPSARSDEYSLAALAYEMLSGAFPYSEYDDVDALRGAVIDPNELPKRIDGLPDAVNDVLLKALSKQPEDRFATCEAFAKALSGTETSSAAEPPAAATGQTTAAKPPSSGQSSVVPPPQTTAAVPQEAAATGSAARKPPVVKIQSPNPPVVKTPSFAAPSAGKSNLTIMLPGDVPLELVHISGGTFTMGSPGAQNRRDVTLTTDYWIGKFPVTQEQYEAMMKQNPSHFKGKDKPVESVSWDEATQFCQMLNMRLASQLPDGFSFSLPTEAQWECAGRAGTTAGPNNGEEVVVILPDGTSPYIDDLGWYARNSQNMTHTVGAKLPNAWGLHDMHGNVQEWCLDRYKEDYAEATDPTGWFEGDDHVLKGGSFTKDAVACGMGERAKSDNKGHDKGFRVALVSKELFRKHEQEMKIQKTKALIEQNKNITNELLKDKKKSLKDYIFSEDFWGLFLVVVIGGGVFIGSAILIREESPLRLSEYFVSGLINLLFLGGICYHFNKLLKILLRKDIQEKKQELAQLEKQLAEYEKK